MLLATTGTVWCAAKRAVLTDTACGTHELHATSWRTQSFVLHPVQLAYGEAQALDRVMYEEEVRREALSFEQQFHYGDLSSFSQSESSLHAAFWKCTQSRSVKPDLPGHPSLARCPCPSYPAAFTC